MSKTTLSNQTRQASDGQYQAALRLTRPEMAHIEPRTTHVDVQSYLDDSVFKREQLALFRRLPVPAAVSQDLPKPGTFMSVEVAGVPVILTRPKSGPVKAFLNTCTHRGTRLLDNGECGAGLKLTCVYHAWTFSLQGKLIGVPREEIFKDLDKENHHLAELPCFEGGGLIWVSLDREAKLDAEAIGPELLHDFDSIGVPQMHVFKTHDFELNANWKLLSDAFLEGYHVTRLHAKTLARFFVDAPQMIERVGRHLRQTSGSRRGFSAADVQHDWNELRKAVVYAYIAFPNVIVVTSPVYVSVTILTPVANDRTLARYIMLVDESDPSPELQGVYERSFKLMADAFGNEDFRAAELSQQGLRTGALKTMTLGGMEQGIRYFHDLIEEYGGSASSGEAA
ncbi:MAG TPA: aromatic ring-hydroxylating dioxygenase subunit alpha [Solimonas sp.]